MTNQISIEMSQNMTTVGQLISQQKYFQSLVGNDCSKVTFDTVQLALSHNLYQSIEFQEVCEAEGEDKKEELIDYLLFMINKYIFLGIGNVLDLSEISLDYLYTKLSYKSLDSLKAYADLEQSYFISFIRHDVAFKPWKKEKSKELVNAKSLVSSFRYSLDTFSKMSYLVFDSYEDMISHLVKKLYINIERQKVTV